MRKEVSRGEIFMGEILPIFFRIFSEETELDFPALSKKTDGN
jgi:hypothetical protein